MLIFFLVGLCKLEMLEEFMAMFFASELFVLCWCSPLLFYLYVLLGVAILSWYP